MFPGMGRSLGFNRDRHGERLPTAKSATALWILQISHFYSMASDGKLSVEERLELIQTVNSLPDSQFKELVFVLKPPPGVLSAGAAAQGHRSSELLQWAEESPTGPGLVKLQQVLDRVLGKEPELPAPPPDASFREDLGSGVTLEMIHIPEGRFWMGSPASEEGREDTEAPQHRVNVSAFFMGKYPVTQRQWYAVSLLDDVERVLESSPSRVKGDDCPVGCVSWDDAVEFCKRLSKKTGKDYRLPSEAEWEYACRARTTTPFFFGKRITRAQADCKKSYGEKRKIIESALIGAGMNMFILGVRAGLVKPTRIKTEVDRYQRIKTEVGRYQPNAFGLYDMHGNAWEWCLDHWHENYDGAPTDGSPWLSSYDNADRLLRGGSWDVDPVLCRSANRNWDARDYRSYDIGFRVVCASSWTP